VFLISRPIFSETCLVLKIIQGDIVINTPKCSCKLPFSLVRF